METKITENLMGNKAVADALQPPEHEKTTYPDICFAVRNAERRGYFYQVAEPGVIVMKPVQ